MASQQDLQELLRLMTAGMKLPIKDAMARIKSLQTNGLRSIQQIVDAQLSDVEAAIQDKKAARSLQNACKARLKSPNNSSTAKRTAGDLAYPSKRPKTSLDMNGPDPVPPHEYEASLELPVDTNENHLSTTTLLTNRAPLVLAFAVELLRITMPEQPPSSRLSLAQAVVSANSRSKAVFLGIEKGRSANEEGWGHGQPKVKVLGREISVLKRGGYDWKAGGEGSDNAAPMDKSMASSATLSETSQPKEPENSRRTDYKPELWSTSQSVSLKGSTFVVRAINLAELSQRQTTLQSLFDDIPSLQTASHNAWAFRVQAPTNLFNATTVKEGSFDDGEAGCGEFLLKNMREMGTVNTLAVMTRWYGGVMLGPDRWRIMRDCLKDALAERGRLTGEQATLGGEAVWGLDLEAMKDKSASDNPASSRSYQAGVIGMPIHRPEAAKAYLLKSFATRVEQPGSDLGTSATIEGTDQVNEQSSPRKGSTPKKKSTTAIALEKEENVARLLGAIRLLYQSWAGILNASELDRRAWSWYVAVRPEVESGPSGWGAKGQLQLSKILSLRRKEDPS
ncbi:hypothetical protein F5Y15DRAFT_100420 [Xylariaceae sp. FL0016]|nr:hypothetical protein F5Y15DRAFT_100420 [Xylariaceae sp. FL0016]